MYRRFFCGCSVAAQVMMSSCRQEPTIPAPAIVIIEVTPQSPVLSLGSTVQLSLKTYGFALDGGFVWRSSNESVAQVTKTGLVIGVGPGDADVFVRVVADTMLSGRTHVTIR